MSKLIPHIVLRAIAIGGERIEPGSLVDLGPVLGAELAAASKVRRATEADLADELPEAIAPDRVAHKPAEPAPEVRRRAKTKPAEEAPDAPEQPAPEQPAPDA